jgi:hypothetical protein
VALVSTLDPSQRRALAEDGYIVLPGAVPRPLIEEALRTINHSLGEVGIARDQLPTFRARTYTPELVGSEPIRRLYTDSPLGALAESCIGPGKVRTPREGQIALRFPTRDHRGAAVPHIDGISAPGNGVAPGTLYHFTALGAVFLSDVLEPDRGNFTVWPGSHRIMEAHLRTHGAQAIVDRFPDLELPPPRQILAKAGDALLAHYQLAHGISPNLGPHIRYAVFFRLFHKRHEAHGSKPLQDLWLEWDGMQDAPKRAAQ